jgi:hypothetical protein
MEPAAPSAANRAANNAMRGRAMIFWLGRLSVLMRVIDERVQEKRAMHAREGVLYWFTCFVLGRHKWWCSRDGERVCMNCGRTELGHDLHLRPGGSGRRPRSGGARGEGIIQSEL